MSRNILSDLDNLIKKANAVKTAALAEDGQKVAESISTKLDNADDGTSPATTGEQAASQVSAIKETYPEPAVDAGAEDNKVGESVDESTDGATAVATDGQEGTTGGKLESAGGIAKADNGDEVTDAPKNDGFNSGAFKEAKKTAAALRKQASSLREAAQALLSPVDKFLVKSARAAAEKNPQLKKAMEGMLDAEIAEGAANGMEQQIGAEIGEDEAAQILEEMVQSGAISQEELAEAAAAMSGGGGEMPVEPPMEGGDMGMGELPPEEMMGAKLAASHIGPDHPDYLKKLASLYPKDIQHGMAFCMKLAEELMAEQVEETEEPEETEKSKESEDGGGEVVEEVEEVPAPVAAPIPAPVPAGPLGEATPQTPEEAAALAAVQQELGIDDAQLAQLMAAEAPMAAPVGKLAAALAGFDPALRYRTIIMNKVAALRA